MIRQLSIQNYVLIEHLDLRFDQGLTIITGETGAGKSILLGALGLVLGDRAESGVQSDESKKVVIEAHFDIRAYDLMHFFSDRDIDYHHDLIIRRELTPQGRSRGFVNDTPVGLQDLRYLGKQLMDVHQQFDQLDVMASSFQLMMLDALAGQRDLVAEYKLLWARWQEGIMAHSKMVEQAQAGIQEKDFLEFQIEELSIANLKEGELEKLEAEAIQLKHAETIKTNLNMAYSGLLDSDYAVVEQLRSMMRMLHPLRDISAPLSKLSERMDSLVIEVEDWVAEANQLANNTEGDPGRAEELEVRINMLNKLMHKHRVTDMDGLFDIFKSLQARLDTIANLDDQIEKLRLEIASLEAEVKKLAGRISEGRKSAAIPFVGDVENGLALLGMDKTRLRILIEPSDKYQASGGDQLSFEMAQGEKGKFATIRQAASGGETSRLALVIKSLVAAAIPLPTLVFDEIDAGVSGMVSMRMGDLLTTMAQNHQLIVITHSPQIAARAQTHLMVSKEEKQGKVTSRVEILAMSQRINAIAIMLSTDPPTPSAIANARELIG